MSRRVIYTALVGDYDEIVPIKAGINYDCFMFTDIALNKAPKNTGWTFLKIDSRKGKSKNLINRWYKMHPHLLFPNHKSSIYIDANVQINDFSEIESRILDLEKTGFNISISDHIYRDCIYKEANAVVEFEKDTKKNVDDTVAVLKQDGYPEDNGLYENNFIFRHHHDPKVIALMHHWWDFINQYSCRDQLSLCYLLWKDGVESTYFFGQGNGVRNHKDITFYSSHKVVRSDVIDKKIKFLCRIKLFLCKFIIGKGRRRHLRNKITGKSFRV